MADLKPVYLVCGDDDVKIDAWRARVKSRAEQESGQGSLEQHDAGAMPPDALAADLAALTFATGTRYILIEGVDGWKAAQLDPLERALTDMPPETVLVMVARGKAQARLCKAVEKAGGEVREYEAPNARQLGKWTMDRAAEQSLQIDAEAARTLVALVGPRQQRLAREVERLALLAYPEGKLDATQVAEMAAGESSLQAYELADAIVAGNVRHALAVAELLSVQGEPPGRLLYSVVRRLREVHRAAELLDAGVRENDAAGKLGMPPWLAKRIIAAAKKAGRQALEDAICAFAQLEIDLRGGGLRADFSFDEDTALSLAIVRACGGIQRRTLAPVAA
ncbi:MAG: polymerase subunit delta [Thermoleophilaceae bacterium]|jgi:DNA polymerase-3 subunit delta|nr:polymerase subunit delta [Thermoleophilaceae bacterium]